MLGLVALLSAGNPWVAEPQLSRSRAGRAGVTIAPPFNTPRTDDLSPAFLRQLAEVTPSGCDGSDICVIDHRNPFDACDICAPFPGAPLPGCDGSDICEPFPDYVAPIAAIGSFVAPPTSGDDGNVVAYWMIPIAGVIVAVILLAAFGFLAPAAAAPAASTTSPVAKSTPDVAAVSATADAVVTKAPVPITEVEIVTSK